MNEDEIVCYFCGHAIQKGSECKLGEETFCSTCVEGYCLCTSCSVLLEHANAFHYRDDGYCDDCFHERFSYCVCCTEAYDNNDSNCWGGLCPGCSDEHFVCTNCEETYHTRNYGGNGLCDECYNSLHTVGLHSYHAGADCGTHYHPTDKENLYFGIELETDIYDDRDSAISSLLALSNSEQLFWMEEDCSLSHGIEIISQPCTLDYHRDYFPWTEIAKTVLENGGKSHDTLTCGLHIHFSRRFFDDAKNQTTCVVKLVYIFERFYKQLSLLSRRGGSSGLLHNARTYDVPMFDKPSREKLDDLSHKYSRYQAVNLQNRNTIEIRIFQGTLKVSSILAAIELVDFLVRLAKITPIKQLQVLTWIDLVNRIDHKRYQYLPQYIVERFGNITEDETNVLNRS